MVTMYKGDREMKVTDDKEGQAVLIACGWSLKKKEEKKKKAK